jgi:carbon-monoxide dehydrogenase small subunit
MLVTARDIVLRLPGADEARIRKELAGNLCRCTGYVGIVRAIRSVLANRGEAEGTRHREERQRRGDLVAHVDADAPRLLRDDAARNDTALRPEHRQDAGKSKDPQSRANAPTFHQSFTVNRSREKVWAFFSRLDQVTQCLPGATVTGTPADDRVDVTLRVKLGPIAPEFHGSAEATRDEATWSGVIRGSARDARSPSTTRGEIRYALAEENGGAATRVNVDIEYTLTGPLAQFGRSGLVQDIARRMTAAFAQNVERRLDDERGASGAAPSRPPELNAGSLVLSALWARIKAVVRSVLGR